MHLDGDRLALDPIGQWLLPHDDVAALDLARWRVVKRDAAGQMQPECGQLAAGPADLADLTGCRWPDLLLEAQHLALAIEDVARPGERRRFVEPANVRHRDPQVNVAAIVAPRAGRADHIGDRTLVDVANRVEVEPGPRVDVEIEPA